MRRTPDRSGHSKRAGSRAHRFTRGGETALRGWSYRPERRGGVVEGALPQPGDARPWRQLGPTAYAAAPPGWPGLAKAIERRWGRQARPRGDPCKTERGDGADCALFVRVKRCKFRLSQPAPQAHQTPHVSARGVGAWLSLSHQTTGEKLSGIAHECVRHIRPSENVKLFLRGPLVPTWPALPRTLRSQCRPPCV